MKIKKPIPFSFVIEELEPLNPLVRPMFGCHALYLGEKIVLILRQKEEHKEANGIWIATSHEHHASLRKVFPSMRSISFLGEPPTAWQNLPEESASFEGDAFKLCELVREGDDRIGHVPKSKRKPKKKKKNHKRK